MKGTTDYLDLHVASHEHWGISCQALTKISSYLPDEYEQLVINWLRFNRCNSQPRNIFKKSRITSDIGQFRLSNILNLDETPIPFAYLDGHTYNLKGSKTISGKTDQSGWDKSDDQGVIKQREQHLWHPGVTVKFNETAYNNEELFLHIIDEELIPTLQEAPEVLQCLHSASITTSLIPSGCTGLLQPLDTAVNKPFKQYLREFTDAYTLQKQSIIQKWSTGNKRIMVTHVVSEAWALFQQEKKELITKAFQDVGVTLPVDGSQDKDIHIKGFNNITVGDWNSDILLPPTLCPSESYQPLSLESSYHDALEFFWTCKDYTHHPIDGSSSTSQPHPLPAGGTVLEF
ncbi:hypothetical protein L873DRAFT_1839909 [Choiromyces venosus 120613-1]|uniref:DDE-1 domain-containing protein n=1 Tax=Choiromyces venosus 120613-1 TaxID=1336337 RepID=A0A3N4K463_9PEZI|nr:hypothetical protein L873DRAFT_1839909 [Choiromyces venosus 120613-1]